MSKTDNFNKHPTRTHIFARNSNLTSIGKLLIVFTVTFSLVGLTGPLAGLFQLQTISMPATHATQETTAGAWYPAGAQEQTLSICEGDGAVSTQVGWIQTGQCDAEDWPLTASQQGASVVNCAGSTSVLCSLPVPDHGYFEIQFNLANVFWGIPMQYGNSVAGQELRQGFAHLINKASFAANNAACLGVACVPDDQPTPVCNSSSGCVNGGLPAANPCGWDTKYAESSSSNCVVGAPGGTPYNCNFSTACPTGTLTGSTTYPWQAQIGSPDFCAAAQHFIAAFADAGISGVTPNANCELVAPTGGWPSVAIAVNNAGCTGLVSTANTCMVVRTTEPRRSLGEGIAQDICALFSPAWGKWTTLAGEPFSCDNTNTGSANASCGEGSCPFLDLIEGPDPGTFCGFTTSTTGIPNNCWGIFTTGFGQAFPFDSTLYYEYNSIFATETSVTCTNAPCTSFTPGSPCGGTVFTNSAFNYMYICSPTYDQLSTAMESSTCLASPGPSSDPQTGSSAPTFANCSGGTVAGGAGATSCIGASPVCSAVSAGYQAEDFYGAHVFTLPVYDTIGSEARLSNWPLGNQSSPGWVTAIGGGYEPGASFWDWLNVYSSTPKVAGTFRQSFLTTVNSLNPFDATTLWDFYVLTNIYDSLLVQNPLCTNSATWAARAGVSQCASILQNIDWMTTGHSYLCFPNGPACTATTLGYTPPGGTSAAIQFRLNKANHWQTGAPVTAWDVKYSFVDLNATGAFQSTPLSNVNQINVRDEFTVDVLLKANGPFTETGIGGITIIPGYLWSGCGASTWNGNLGNVNLVGGSIVTTAQDGCVGTFASGGNIVIVGGVSAASTTFDPVANNFLIGSGPWTCVSIGGTGHPAAGTIGGGCSIDNTDSPAFGLGVFTLTRTGCTIASSGTVCGPAGSTSTASNCGGVTGATCEPDYFRSSGALARYIWTGDIGSGNADFSNLLTINSCHSATPGANCAHWAQGIGNAGGSGANNIGLAQTLAVNSLKGVSWIDYGTETSHGTLPIFACVAGYQIPGTTLTRCGASPKPAPGWAGSVLPGIGGYATTLYEYGSQVLGTSTTTLSPATPPGGPNGSYNNCGNGSFKGLPPVGTSATAYPKGGYDC